MALSVFKISAVLAQKILTFVVSLRSFYSSDSFENKVGSKFTKFEKCH